MKNLTKENIQFMQKTEDLGKSGFKIKIILATVMPSITFQEKIGEMMKSDDCLTSAPISKNCKIL